MKILFVAPRLPLPADTGAKIRTYNLIGELSRENDVTLLSFSFDADNDNKNAETLKKRGIKVELINAEEKINPFSIFGSKPLTIAKYYSPKMAVAISRNLANGNFDIVHFDHLHTGQYNRLCYGTPVVVDEHNIESVIFKRLYDMEKNFFKRAIFGNECKKMERIERDICRAASFVSVVSERDRDALLGICGKELKAEVIPNGVDTEYFRAQEHKSTRAQEDSLVFTGSMDWMPNSDAVEYFCNDILPLIWEKKPEVKFYVVGRNPTQKIIEFGKKNKRIIVTGKVDDVRPYMEKAKVFVVPLRIGGGTRLKILEAMSMRKAAVSTPIGAEGIDYTENGDIVLAGNPQEFADKVLMLLENDKKATEIGAQGRRLVCDKYDWGIVGQRLKHIYEEAARDTR